MRYVPESYSDSDPVLTTEQDDMFAEIAWMLGFDASPQPGDTSTKSLTPSKPLIEEPPPSDILVKKSRLEDLAEKVLARFNELVATHQELLKQFEALHWQDIKANNPLASQAFNNEFIIPNRKKIDENVAIAEKIREYANGDTALSSNMQNMYLTSLINEIEQYLDAFPTTSQS